MFLVKHTVVIFAQQTIDPLYITTSIVYGLKEKSEKVIASGFFYKDRNGKIYLVTNKHVIYGERFAENLDPLIDQIKITLHLDPKDLSKNDDYVVSLFEDKKRIWLELESKPEIDVVLIPIAIDENRYFFVTLNRDFIEIPNIKIGFEKIFIMGYPYGWYDKLNNLPITRVGHLSSPFKIPFQGNKVMLGDVETHKGMSGSPVLMKLKDYVEIKDGRGTVQMGKTRTILVGIYSGQPLWVIENKTTGEKHQIRHTLATIWFSDLIIDILDQNK